MYPAYTCLVHSTTMIFHSLTNIWICYMFLNRIFTGSQPYMHFLKYTCIIISNFQRLDALVDLLFDWICISIMTEIFSHPIPSISEWGKFVLCMSLVCRYTYLSELLRNSMKMVHFKIINCLWRYIKDVKRIENQFLA